MRHLSIAEWESFHAERIKRNTMKYRWVFMLLVMTCILVVSCAYLFNM